MQNNIGPVPLDNNAKPGEILPQSMNSDITIQKQSYFKNIQINPINGSSQITINNIQQQTQFEIPISCFNPYWTVLSFTVACGANGLGGSYQKISTSYCSFFN